SPDPYVQMPDNSQNFNRYAYCLNNPLIYTDPSGEFIFTALAVICYSILSICKNYFNIDCTID
ncbi:MAG: RHS repeat-associated core domain-containing protein, partial [Bacteroidota bacterium]